MTLVLPMAGVQKYFCTTSMAFVEGAESCQIEHKDCRNKEHKPTKPDCFVSAKLLPNASESTRVHLPKADAQWTIVLVSMVDLPPVIVPMDVFPEKERGPPDWACLFLIQKRLLI